MNIGLVCGGVALVGLLAVGPAALAQFGPPPRPSVPPLPAERAASFDLTGYWTAVITEDWRWRMLTPPRGDFDSVPLNPEGRKAGMQFNPAAYGSGWNQSIDCRAYGAAGLMRMPTRVHITWADPNTMSLQTDWGEQARIFHFVVAKGPGLAPASPDRVPAGSDTAAREIHTPSLQGYSVAMWERPIPLGQGSGFGPGASLPGGDLKVITTGLAPGWLRRNGVPYSTQTRLTEYYQTFTDPLGHTWFDVTTEVVDPIYLTAPFITSSDFRREPDGAEWAPHPCRG